MDVLYHLNNWRQLQQGISNCRIDYTVAFEDSVLFFNVYNQNARNLRPSNPRDVEAIKTRLTALADYDLEYPELETLPLRLIHRHGQVYDVSGIKYKLMRPKRCHENAFLLYYLGIAKHMCTGFVLNMWPDSNEKRWSQHSWCLDENNNIIETTAKVYGMYFGTVVPQSASSTRYTVPPRQLRVLSNVVFDSVDLVERVQAREYSRLLQQVQEGNVVVDSFYELEVV